MFLRYRQNRCIFIHKPKWDSILQLCTQLFTYLPNIKAVFGQSFSKQTLQIHNFRLLNFVVVFYDTMDSQLSYIQHRILELSHWNFHHLRHYLMVYRYPCQQRIGFTDIVFSRVVAIRRLQVYEKNITSNLFFILRASEANYGFWILKISTMVFVDFLLLLIEC